MNNIHYSGLIEYIITTNKRQENLVFSANCMDYVVDEKGNIKQIVQLPDTKLSSKTYEMLTNITDINSEIWIRLNEIGKRRCAKLISRYGYIKTFSSRYLPYIESPITEILLGKVSKKTLMTNHNSCCILIQSFGLNDISNNGFSNRSLAKLNKLLASIKDIKLVITNINGIIPDGDIAFVVTADKFINNLSFDANMNIEITANQKSKYYRHEDYEDILSDISKIIKLT